MRALRGLRRIRAFVLRYELYTEILARPVLSALSRAVGTPAFSISQLLFIFVEGEEGVGERERFRKLAGVPQNVRFMECGSCNEVLRRVASIKAIAKESEAGIRIGGVVDRDFRSTAESDALNRDSGIFVLPVHESENYFLFPVTLSVLLQQNGRGELNPIELIRDAADTRAGSWLFQHAMATRNAKGLPEISVPAKEFAKSLTWAQFNADRQAAIQKIVAASGFGEDDQRKFGGILTISADAYERRRGADDLWKTCEGKQVLNDIARAVGFAGTAALIQAAFVAWDRGGGQISGELTAFRQYLAGI